MHALELDIEMFPGVFILNSPFPIAQPAGGFDENGMRKKKVIDSEKIFARSFAKQ